MDWSFYKYNQTQKMQETYQRDMLVHCKYGGISSPVVFPALLSISNSAYRPIYK